MKVRSVIAAFALVGATSAAPSTQNIEERQAPTCGVVGNDKGWLRAPSYNDDAANDDYDSAGNVDDAADYHNFLSSQIDKQHDLAGVDDFRPSSEQHNHKTSLHQPPGEHHGCGYYKQQQQQQQASDQQHNFTGNVIHYFGWSECRQRQSCKPVPTASSGKRGLSFNDPKFTNLFSATSCTPNSVGRSRTSWAYNWFSAPCDDFNHASLCSVPFNPYLEFIPMLWSNDRDLQNAWNSNVQAAAARGWKTVLAFNEPDIAHSGGSGMSIADAVTSWKQYIQPLKAQGFRLGSPAVTNAQGLNMGNDWQVKFLDQTPGKGGCIGCTVDFLAVHWYGGPTDLDSFFNHVAYSWSVVGGQRMPVWITEFGITGGTDAQVENFLRVVIDAFENQPDWSFVERYAWFTASNSSPTSGPLVAANGTSLSRAGQVYENQV
ncbi:hypothetical protein TI39_contig46g00005 [Zymoseptoria brevis]|uniref:Asl1-like glycosyl hydrolase catalytic domain-containing protein n=1 Tax=Zymoseptoria brevis TaxID=1047168 RepID=A0A0F4H1Y5_9PEZI|nr:hypothetical protein TI39_contig46g00005 [Zymoseptoria brevis]